jgi:cytidyltransferase-like protein
MIVTFDRLPEFRGAVSMVDGAFDPLHAGHVEYFRAAAALGLPLLCNVSSDWYVRTKHAPLLPDWQRAAVIDALRDITYTHLSQYDTETVLEQLQPANYVKGKDWEGRLPPRQIEICGRLGIQICFLDTVRDSSSRLLRQFAEDSARSAEPQTTAGGKSDEGVPGEVRERGAAGAPGERKLAR